LFCHDRRYPPASSRIKNQVSSLDTARGGQTLTIRFAWIQAGFRGPETQPISRRKAMSVMVQSRPERGFDAVR